MPVLVTADWHLTASPKDSYRFQAMDWLEQCIRERDVDRLIILGDLTHDKNYHSDWLVNAVVDNLANFSELCPVDILQGNHDYVEADTPFFRFVRLLPNVDWVSLPTMKDVRGLGRCCFLPHTRDYKKDWAVIREFWNETNGVIFAHNAFEGAVADTGKKLSGIPLNIFPKGQAIISGDIHAPQTIGNLTYVGAPYTQKFGDNFTPRVLLIDNGGFESIEVPGSQKRLYEIENLDQLKYLPQQNDMVKVRYYLSAEERDYWPEIKQAIQDWFKGIETLIIQPIPEKKGLARLSTKAIHKEDKELVKQYGKREDFSPEVMVAGYELIDA